MRASQKGCHLIDNDNEVRQDFFYILDLCREIDEVFPRGCKEHKLAKDWMNFLCTYDATTIPKRRLKNVYLSHLCAGLFQSKLYGPFLAPPKDTLEKVDFLAPPLTEDDAPASDTSREQEKGPGGTKFLSQMAENLGVCKCPPKPCDCGATEECSCKRTSGGSEFGAAVVAAHCISCNTNNHDAKTDGAAHFKPEFLVNINTSLASFVNLCNVQCIQGNRTSLNATTNDNNNNNGRGYHHHSKTLSINYSPSTDEDERAGGTCEDNEILSKKSSNPLNNNNNNDHSNGDDDATTISTVSIQRTTSDASMMTLNDMKNLLDAITAELRGETEPGNSEALERELGRYKPFLLSQPDIGRDLEKLKPDIKIRHFLLLSLQKDLIKLIMEEP